MDTFYFSHVHELEYLIFLKCPYYPNCSTDSTQISIKIPMACSYRNGENPKIYMEPFKELQIAKTILRKNKVEGITSNFKL